MRTRYVPWAAVAALLLALGWPPGAAAQSVCAPRDAVVATLEKDYSEVPVSRGLSSNGAVIEVLASPSGTWTIVATRATGLTCMIAAGEGWENLVPRDKRTLERRASWPQR